MKKIFAHAHKIGHAAAPLFKQRHHLNQVVPPGSLSDNLVVKPALTQKRRNHLGQFIVGGQLDILFVERFQFFLIEYRIGGGHIFQKKYFHQFFPADKLAVIFG